MNSIANLARYFQKIIKFKTAPKLEISNFTPIQHIYNNDPNSYCRIEFFDNSNCKYVGLIVYRLTTGQIYTFYLENEYRNQGLGKQIIEQTIKHMKDYNTPYIWLNIKKQHYFWSNIKINENKFQWCDKGKLFNSSSSQTGVGYQMKITY